MAAPMHVQLHNAESAILFMQQEHAKTLQGLHQELQKLQKKCAELTFELAMKSEAPDEESYVKQQKVLEAQLKEKATECEEVKREIEHRDTRISRLEQQVKDQERHHQAVIKQHQQQVLMLSRELEQRSSSIAYLTTQLHQLKLRQQSRGGEEVGPANEWAGTPTPPKDKPHHMRRHKVRSTSVGLENVKVPLRAVHPSGLDHSGLLDYASYVAEAGTTPQYIVRTRRSGSAGPHHHNSATHSRTDIMNLQPFLAKGTDHSRDTLRPTPPPVLPPITSSEDRNRNLLDKRTVFSKRGVHRSNTEFEQAVATETLAVEQVCLREKGLRQLEQSKSD
ncbi:coiled-coil domain-containing protein 92-like [Acanthaster planci]|uniref:Coiled-coil domain-containing protein 92-like n=1 Tax=Acanthaster planci TaxID=133434 RepID=A0A8B7YJ37_ACAPL|nr:coiled-coil domain-containing protein 92-like [Acanthaster planci]XP_022093265.1 coiled-coil domain-containing protein 92-like [Acanthaster planci]